MKLVAKQGSVPCYQQLKELLIQDIQLLKPGDRLPSIRNLIQRSKLSHQTVVKAMTELQADGYIDLEHGRGAFVAQRSRAEYGAPTGPNGTVIVVTPEWDDRQIYCVQHEATIQAVRSGRTLASWRIHPGATCEQLARFARTQEHLAGIIVLHPAQDLAETDAAHLSALGVPIIFLQPGSPRGENLHTVSGDPLKDGALMARHLIAAGHRRLAFAQVQPRSSITDAMVAGARAEVQTAGLRSLQVIECGTRSWSDPLDAIPAACREIGDATGVICTTGLAAFAAVRAFRRLGLRVPEDISVIGSADDPLLAHADPAITVTTLDFAEMLATAFGLIAADAPLPSTIVHVPVRVIERESIRHIRK